MRPLGLDRSAEGTARGLGLILGRRAHGVRCAILTNHTGLGVVVVPEGALEYAPPQAQGGAQAGAHATVQRIRSDGSNWGRPVALRVGAEEGYIEVVYCRHPVI